MKKPINTMRRKVIEESKPDRDASQNASNTMDALTGIHDRLGDVQSATELTGETVEQKANDIIKGLADVEAAAELTAEQTEGTTQEVRKLNDVASKISDKLSKLTNMLEAKLTAQNPSGNTGEGNSGVASTALSVINEKLPEIKTSQDEIQDAIAKLIPDDSPEPDADFLPHTEPETVQPNPNNPSDETRPEGAPPSDNPVLEKLDQLIKVSKEGFKSSLGFADKISSMLFKYTVSAAIGVAKIAAMILTIILAIDLIRIHFDYWTKLFNSSFTEFNEKAKEWGPLLESIVVAANEIKKAFENGDWSGLAIAIVKGIGSTIANLGELLILGISKMAAAIFRAFGKDDRADEIEGDALRTFVEHTGAKLNDKDSNTLARFDAKKLNENADMYKKYTDMSPNVRGIAEQYGSITKDELTKADNGDYDPLGKLSPEDQLSAVKARNNAEASMVRFSRYLDESDPNDPANSRNVEQAYKEVSTNMKSGDLSKAPLLEKMIKDQFDAVNDKYNKFKSEGAKVNAEPASNKEDAQTIGRIEKVKAQNTQSAGVPQTGNTMTQINTVNKTNKTQYSLPPQSSTPAPGMPNALKVN